MGILEIISAVCLILACIFIIIMVLMQDSKRGMSQTLTGGSGDNFYQKNSGRSKEARLARATRTAAILFFVVTLAANVFAIYFTGDTGTVAPPSASEDDNIIDFSGVPDFENMTEEELFEMFGLNEDGHDPDDGEDHTGHDHD